MDDAKTTQASEEFLMHLEKVSHMFLEHLKQARNTGLTLDSFRVVIQVADFLSASLSTSPTQHKACKTNKQTQTDSLERSMPNGNIDKEILKPVEDKNELKNPATIPDTISTVKKITEGKISPNLSEMTVLIRNCEASTPRRSFRKAQKSVKQRQWEAQKDLINNNHKESFENLTSDSTDSLSFIKFKKRKLNSDTASTKLLTPKSNKHLLKRDEVARKLQSSLQNQFCITKLKKLAQKEFIGSSKLGNKNSYAMDETETGINGINTQNQNLNNKHYNQRNHTHQNWAQNKRCDFCGQSFQTIKDMGHHTENFHGFLQKKSKQAELLICDLCNMSHKETEEMAIHIKSHLVLHKNAMRKSGNKQQRFECEVCNKILATLPALLAHKKRHQGTSNFHCDFCSETFSDISQLKSHREKHSKEERPYKCPLCGKGFRTSTTLRTHKMLHTGELPYECDICGKRFIQTSGLNAHKLRHTAEEETANKTEETRSEDKSMSCTICGQIYKTQFRLKAHMKSHDQTSDLSCEFCSKMFTSAREAAIHRRTHFEGKLICKVCGQSFESRSELYFHTQSHEAGERPHLCSTCGKAFITFNDLKVHQKRHEMGPEEKKSRDPFVCTVCGKIYVSRSSLTVHMKVHAGVFDLPCDLCPKKFKTPAELRHHRRVHTKEKPYVCDVCNKAFSRHSTLANHKRSHSSERPFLCNVCGAGFKLMNTLKKHCTIHARGHKTTQNSNNNARRCKVTAQTNVDLEEPIKPQTSFTEPEELQQLASYEAVQKDTTAISNEEETGTTISFSPSLKYEQLVSPPFPYPNDSLRAAMSTDTDTTPPLYQPDVEDLLDQKMYLNPLEHQGTDEPLRHTNNLLGLVPHDENSDQDSEQRSKLLGLISPNKYTGQTSNLLGLVAPAQQIQKQSCQTDNLLKLIVPQKNTGEETSNLLSMITHPKPIGPSGKETSNLRRVLEQTKPANQPDNQASNWLGLIQPTKFSGQASHQTINFQGLTAQSKPTDHSRNQTSNLRRLLEQTSTANERDDQASNWLGLIQPTKNSVQPNEQTSNLLRLVAQPRPTLQPSQQSSSLLGLFAHKRPEEQPSVQTSNLLGLLATPKPSNQHGNQASNWLGLIQPTNPSDQLKAQTSKLIGLVAHNRPTDQPNNQTSNLLGLVAQPKPTSQSSNQTGNLLGILATPKHTGQQSLQASNWLGLIQPTKYTAQPTEQSSNQASNLVGLLTPTQHSSQQGNQTSNLLIGQQTGQASNWLGLIQPSHQTSKLLRLVTHTRPAGQPSQQTSNLIGLVTPTKRFVRQQSEQTSNFLIDQQNDQQTDQASNWLGLIQPTKQSQPLGETSNLLQMAPQNTRPVLQQSASKQLQTNMSNPMLSFSSQFSHRPRQPVLLTVGQPQNLVHAATPSRQVQALGLFHHEDQFEDRPILTRSVTPPEPLMAGYLHRPRAHTHQLLQLPARLQLTSQRPLVRLISQRPVQPSQFIAGSIDQPLYRLQNQMAQHTTPNIAGHGGLRQPLQTLVPPPSLLMNPEELIPDDEPNYEPSTGVLDEDLHDHEPTYEPNTPVLGDNDLHDQPNLLETPPPPTSPPVFSDTPAEPTLVMLNTSHHDEAEEMLSLDDNDDDPLALHSSEDIGAMNDDNIMGQIGEEEDEEDEEMTDDNSEREPTPNLLDLTNTTTYTYYYY